METETNTIKDAIMIADTTASPTPLGLLAFGMTTVLLNLHNTGFFAMGSAIFAMGIFFGGIAQIIAGIMEWKKNNTFGTTAFVSYGFFWVSLVGLILMPVLGWSGPLQREALVSFFTLWGLFSFVMFIITLRLPKTFQLIFGSLTLLFLLLIAGNMTGNVTVLQIAGVVGIICGLSAMYTGLGQVMNEVYKEQVIRLG